MLKILCLFILFVNSMECYQRKFAPLVTTKPSWVTTCKKNDAKKLNDCFKELINSLAQQAIKGNAKINVDPIEPLYVENMPITKKNGIVRLSGSLQNLTVKGLSRMEIKDAKIDHDKHTVSVNIYVPEITTKGVYDFKGNILLLQIMGKGDSTVEVKGSSNKLEIDYDMVAAEGGEIMQLTNIKKFDLDREHVHIQLDNLFNGNKFLGDNANRFINNNANNLAKQVETLFVENLAPTILDIMNNVLDKVPISMMFEE